jgi:hypothetical protein
MLSGGAPSPVVAATNRTRRFEGSEPMLGMTPFMDMHDVRTPFAAARYATPSATSCKAASQALPHTCCTHPPAQFQFETHKAPGAGQIRPQAQRGSLSRTRPFECSATYNTHSQQNNHNHSDGMAVEERLQRSSALARSFAVSQGSDMALAAAVERTSHHRLGATSPSRKGGARGAPRAAGVVAGASLEDGHVVVSLAVPMRLLPPRSFHCPDRVPLPASMVPSHEAVPKALFDKIKNASR